MHTSAPCSSTIWRQRRTTAHSRRYHDLLPGRYVRLSVCDTGPGIPPAIIPRIFDPFFTTRKMGEGTGMGLSVAHGIVKSHHGGIFVESGPGQGACFDILLPVLDAGEESVRVNGTPQKLPTGMELAQEMLRVKPGLPVILCSGFSELITEAKLESIGIGKLVMKPLEIQELALAIRELLDRRTAVHCYALWVRR